MLLLCLLLGTTGAQGKQAVQTAFAEAEVDSNGDVHRRPIASFDVRPRITKQTRLFRSKKFEGPPQINPRTVDAAVATVGQQESRIPMQLILTGRNESFDMLRKETRENIQKILTASPQIRMRWFGDDACGWYIFKHYGVELFKFFKGENRGSLRGDMCRTAVLLREGGFYLDLDVELLMPLDKLIDNATTFASVYEYPEKHRGGILNAVIAAEPGSPVLSRTMAEMRTWYRQPTKQRPNGTYVHMGPITLMRGLVASIQRDCPREDLEMRKAQQLWVHPTLQWKCGPHALRLYIQKPLLCDQEHSNRECNEKRAKASVKFDGAGFGIFVPGPERQLIGYPRPDWCDSKGCGLGGSDKLSKPHKLPKKLRKKDVWHMVRLCLYVGCPRGVFGTVRHVR